jgi:hypothetical protein
VTEDLATDLATDLAVVRSSYDRVADNYVTMGMGDLGPTPWLRAALTAFAEDVAELRLPPTPGQRHHALLTARRPGGPLSGR